MYERGCPDNYYLMQPNYQYCITLLSSHLLLLIFASSQHYFGSRFFIPKICRPSYFDYYQKYIVYSNQLPEDDDCCICMMHLHENPDKEQKKSFGAVQRLLNDNPEPQQEIQDNLTNPLLAEDNSNSNDSVSKGEKMKSKIMVTPCRHKFHVSCLESWMKIRLICPTCRAHLPSIE